MLQKNVSGCQKVQFLKVAITGKSSQIAAGSIMTKNIPSGGFTVGIPAKLIPTWVV